MTIGVLVDGQSVLGHLDRSFWQLDMLDDFKVAGRRQPEPLYFAIINFILDRLVNALRWQ